MQWGEASNGINWTGLVDENRIYEYILGTPFVRYMGYFFTFLSYFGGLYGLITFYTCLSRRRFKTPKTAINVNLWSRQATHGVEDLSDDDEGEIVDDVDNCHPPVYPDAPPAYDEK